MPFKPNITPSADAPLPDFSKLLAAYVAHEDQQKNYLLFQTISNFLRDAQRLKDIFKNQLEELEQGQGSLAEADFLTHSDESVALPNSRNLLAGTGITFDDTVANERTINAGQQGYWTPLVLSNEDGDAEFILTDNGAPIAVFFPTT